VEASWNINREILATIEGNGPKASQSFHTGDSFSFVFCLAISNSHVIMSVCVIHSNGNATPLIKDLSVHLSRDDRRPVVVCRKFTKVEWEMQQRPYGESVKWTASVPLEFEEDGHMRKLTLEDLISWPSRDSDCIQFEIGFWIRPKAAHVLFDFDESVDFRDLICSS